MYRLGPPVLSIIFGACSSRIIQRSGRLLVKARAGDTRVRKNMTATSLISACLRSVPPPPVCGAHTKGRFTVQRPPSRLGRAIISGCRPLVCWGPSPDTSQCQLPSTPLGSVAPVRQTKIGCAEACLLRFKAFVVRVAGLRLSAHIRRALRNRPNPRAPLARGPPFIDMRADMGAYGSAKMRPGTSGLATRSPKPIELQAVFACIHGRGLHQAKRQGQPAASPCAGPQGPAGREIRTAFIPATPPGNPSNQGKTPSPMNRVFSMLAQGSPGPSLNLLQQLHRDIVGASAQTPW